jgi:two-component sensor histidine kinase
VRRKRSGEPVHIEVSISPVRDSSGAIIGASKIARDIGDRLRHAEEQALLVREMQHRIKNLLSVVQALVSVGRRRADDVGQFADELTSRIAALADAQQLVLN